MRFCPCLFCPCTDFPPCHGTPTVPHTGTQFTILDDDNDDADTPAAILPVDAPSGNNATPATAAIPLPGSSPAASPTPVASPPSLPRPPAAPPPSPDACSSSPAAVTTATAALPAPATPASTPPQPLVYVHTGRRVTGVTTGDFGKEGGGGRLEERERGGGEGQEVERKGLQLPHGAFAAPAAWRGRGCVARIGAGDFRFCEEMMAEVRQVIGSLPIDGRCAGTSEAHSPAPRCDIRGSPHPFPPLRTPAMARVLPARSPSPPLTACLPPPVFSASSLPGHYLLRRPLRVPVPGRDHSHRGRAHSGGGGLRRCVTGESGKDGKTIHARAIAAQLGELGRKP